MISISESVTPSASLLAKSKKFVCHMCGKSELSSVDEAQYQLYCAKGYAYEQLPPTAQGQTKKRGC